MLKSMTAYANVERTDQALTVCMEIRTYNSRHLDAVLRLPQRYLGFEEKIKKMLTGAFVRGRVEVRVKIQADSEADCAYAADVPKAKAYLRVADQLKQELKLPGDLSVDQVLAIPGLITPVDNSEVDGHWPLLAASLQTALEQVNGMRQKEGQFLEQDILQRLEVIEKGLAEIESVASVLKTQYRDKLQARIEAMTQGVVELDTARIAQEAALLADRSDISEEIVRSRSHVNQFRAIIADDAPAGRKLNFLLQEFNREFNTMGAKVGQADAAHTIVDIKAEIEKLREQIQNIE